MWNKKRHSESSIIENLSLKGLLPENKEARSIIINYLYADNEISGVRHALNAIFSNNAAGINWNSKHSNFKPLVEFCIQYSLPNPIRKDSEGHIPYLLSQFRSIIVRINDCRDACIKPVERKLYSSQLEKANLLIDAVETSQNITVKNYFQLIYDCWDMLYDWSITYRYLCALTALCDFQEDVDAKSRLCDIITEISKEW